MYACFFAHVVDSCDCRRNTLPQVSPYRLFITFVKSISRYNAHEKFLLEIMVQEGDYFFFCQSQFRATKLVPPGYFYFLVRSMPNCEFQVGLVNVPSIRFSIGIAANGKIED